MDKDLKIIIRNLLKIIGVLIIFGMLLFFKIGSTADKIIICILSLIYWELQPIVHSSTTQ